MNNDKEPAIKNGGDGAGGVCVCVHVCVCVCVCVYCVVSLKGRTDR